MSATNSQTANEGSCYDPDETRPTDYYEHLEREHMGGPDKKTGIYAQPSPSTPPDQGQDNLVERLRYAHDNPATVESWRDLVAEAADMIEGGAHNIEVLLRQRSETAPQLPPIIGFEHAARLAHTSVQLIFRSKEQADAWLAAVKNTVPAAPSPEYPLSKREDEALRTSGDTINASPQVADSRLDASLSARSGANGDPAESASSSRCVAVTPSEEIVRTAKAALRHLHNISNPVMKQTVELFARELLRISERPLP